MPISQALKDKTLVTKNTLYNHRTFVVSEKIDIGLNASVSYDIPLKLTNILAAEGVLDPDNYEKYFDLTKIEFKLLVINNTPNSPWLGTYTEERDLVTCGINSYNLFVVVNKDTVVRKIWVQITVYRKPTVSTT